MVNNNFHSQFGGEFIKLEDKEENLEKLKKECKDNGNPTANPTSPLIERKWVSQIKDFDFTDIKRIFENNINKEYFSTNVRPDISKIIQLFNNVSKTEPSFNIDNDNNFNISINNLDHKNSIDKTYGIICFGPSASGKTTLMNNFFKDKKASVLKIDGGLLRELDENYTNIKNIPEKLKQLPDQKDDVCVGFEQLNKTNPNLNRELIEAARRWDQAAMADSPRLFPSERLKYNLISSLSMTESIENLIREKISVYIAETSPKTTHFNLINKMQEKTIEKEKGISFVKINMLVWNFYEQIFRNGLYRETVEGKIFIFNHKNYESKINDFFKKAASNQDAEFIICFNIFDSKTITKINEFFNVNYKYALEVRRQQLSNHLVSRSKKLVESVVNKVIDNDVKKRNDMILDKTQKNDHILNYPYDELIKFSRIWVDNEFDTQIDKDFIKNKLPECSIFDHLLLLYSKWLGQFKRVLETVELEKFLKDNPKKKIFKRFLQDYNFIDKDDKDDNDEVYLYLMDEEKSQNLKHKLVKYLKKAYEDKSFSIRLSYEEVKNYQIFVIGFLRDDIFYNNIKNEGNVAGNKLIKKFSRKLFNKIQKKLKNSLSNKKIKLTSKLPHKLRNKKFTLKNKLKKNKLKKNKKKNTIKYDILQQKSISNIK